MGEQIRILLIGSGGREHALAWKLSQSPRAEHIYCVPGNGGTASGLKNVSNVDEIKANDYEGLVRFAKEKNVGLVIPGPEAPLVDGIESYFRGAGIRCFGPSKAAAHMEGSKTFSKDFMHRNHIPTAEYRNFNQYESAKKYLDSVKHDVVIKADGLAAGKGVIIPTSKAEAEQALREIMLDKEFGAAGNEVVIEEYLEGEELSILAFSDGYTVRALPPAQDHKRIFDGDKGPNTGGMGCYAPTRVVSKEALEEIHKTVLQPTIDGMRKEAFPFVGMLFTGLMITKSGPRVLEYNVRFGDPETQTLLPLLRQDVDLVQIMLACTEHWLDAVDIPIQSGFAATVVVAAAGYPGSYPKGTPMTLGNLNNSSTILFHAGTVLDQGGLKTSGGRVIASSATADTLEKAVAAAYEGVKQITFEGMQYRRDIAYRAFDRDAPKEAEALTYASAGVSIDAGNQLVENIKAAVRSTKRSGANSEIGGFGGVFDLEAAGYSTTPLLIGAIDGVGTKLKIAHAVGKEDTVGIDLVAMNVNDLVVQGAEPLFFLDCYSCSRLDVAKAASFVSGVAEGCRHAGCALIGGETAEMPGLYQGSEYDAVGAAVGAVSKNTILPDFQSMAEGDILLGLASNGVHSNGFSLVRKIIERAGLAYDSPAPWDPATSLGLALLAPTRIYVKSVLQVTRQRLVHGLSHITGGGLTDNVPRMLPSHLAAEIDVATWPVPPVLKWLKQSGAIGPEEFARSFNTGIGMVAVVSETNVDKVTQALTSSGETVNRIGKLVPRKESSCVLKSLDSWR